MNNPAEDIATILLAESDLGLTFATDLFTVKEPHTPINCTTIFDGVSEAPQLTFTKGEDYYYDSVQVRIRHSNYATGYALAHSIMTTLHGIGQDIVNGTLYSLIRCKNGPAPLGLDDNGRHILVMNFEIQRR